MHIEKFLGGSVNKYKLISATITIVLLTSAASVFSQTQKSSTKVVFPSEIKFTINPNDPAGLQTVLLDGDPTKSELYTMQIKIPANIKLLAHWHPETRSVIVLSGTFYYGYGGKFDEKKLIEMPAGTFFNEPSEQPHFAWTKNGVVILQVTGVGPTGKTDLESGVK